MKLTNEARIGIMVAAVAVALIYLTIRTGHYDFRPQGYEVKVYFHNIEGVDKNAPVRLNGLEIGKVKDIRIIYGEDERMELALWINPDAKMHEGSRAYVKNMGLFGEKYVGLTIGDSTKEYLGPGATIIGEEPGNFEKMMGDGEVVAANLREITQQMDEQLKKNRENIDEILANLRVATKNLASITDNVDARLTKNRELIDDTIVHINSATRNFDEMSYDLKLNPWKLMYKERVRKPDMATDGKKK